MEQELIVDGKNVLEPVDLSKDKNEILAARKSIPENVSLNHFKERVALVFSANVKADEANELVSKIQDYFANVYSRVAVLFDNVDTIYRTIETIHKDNIEGIIVAIKSAQKAIEESDYAIQAIKGTLELLEDFMTRLESSTDHLEDIDDLWNKTDGLLTSVESLKKSLTDKIEKNSQKIQELQKYKNSLKKLKHINDVDKIFDDCKSLKKSAEEIKEKLSKFDSLIKEDACKQDAINNDVETRITELERHKSQMDDVAHIMDIDSIWEQTNLLSEFAAGVNRIEHLKDVDEEWDQLTIHDKLISETCNRLDAFSSSNSEELASIKKRIKVLYFITGGSVLVLIITIICSLLGVL